MKKSMLTLSALTCTLLASCGDTTGTEVKPLWQDEFSGSSLDSSKWEPMIGNGDVVGNPGWGNNELEYYTGRPENVTVKDGTLVITARKENITAPADSPEKGKSYTWTSARIRTAGKFSRTYGKFEIRAKMPVGKGLWPAIWMLPEPNEYGTWAANGEIDIAEGWGSKPDVIAHTLHYGGQWPNNVSKGVTVPFPNSGPNSGKLNDWHTYTLEWTSDEMRWLVDGVETAKQTAWWSAKNNPPQSDADLNPWPAPFDRPFHLLLNLAVGGNFDGNPDATTPNQAQMLVDYVRVYGIQGEADNPGPRPDMTYPWTPRPARAALADGNLIYNGTFDWADNDARVQPDTTALDGVNNSKFWTLYQNGGAFTLSNDATQGNALKTVISDGGTLSYAIQVRQDGINIVQGRKYEVSFDAWASQNRTLMVKVGGGQDRGWAAYSGEKTLDVGTTRTRKSFTFDMTAVTDAAARLEFNLGNQGANTVWLDNVVVKDVGAAAGARPPAADGNLIYNAGFTQDSPGVPGIQSGGQDVPGTDYWYTWENGASGLTSSVAGGVITLSVAHADVGNDWHVQFGQKNVAVKKGQQYQLSFKASADSPRTVAVVVGQDGGSYLRYLNATAALTTTEQTFTYTFTAPEDNVGAQLQILGAVGAAGDAYKLKFSDVRLVPLP